MVAAIGRADALRAQGEDDAAVQALRDLAVEFADRRQVHSALADMLRRLERYEEATEAYNRVVSLIEPPDPIDWSIYYARGITYERTGKWPQAEADFKLALELEPDHPLVLNYLGYSWVDMGMHLEEAKGMIEKAVELRPDDGYITDSLGWVLYRLEDFEGAVSYLERAVELEPVDPIITDHLGDALWMVGRRIEARFQWKRAISFEPEEKDLPRIQRKLEVGLDQVLAEEAEDTAATEGADETETGSVDANDPAQKPNGG
jgi:Flp pilus assembly protein TadD